MRNWKNKKNQNKIYKTIDLSLHKIFPQALKQHSEEITCRSEETTEGQKPSSEFFDIAYEFESPVMNKQFVVLDYYTKNPITENTVRTFLNKIKFAQNEKKSLRQKSRKTRYTLRGKTLGILVGKTFTQEAITIAKKREISLLALSDFKKNTNNDAPYKKQIKVK